MYHVDLNCDLGESYGRYTLGRDADILAYISSANIACGYHASDPVIMSHTVQQAKKMGVAIGAHPGYPDLNGFGRRNMTLSREEVICMIQYQLGALEAFCHVNHTELTHVKPHGALYNMAAKDKSLAIAICESIASYHKKVRLIGLSGSNLLEAAKETGLSYASEVFADRAYEDDGSLVSRTKKGAMITEESYAIERVIRMIKDGYVTSITGNDIPITVDTICVHGDSDQALNFVKHLRLSFTKEDIQVISLNRSQRIL